AGRHGRKWGALVSAGGGRGLHVAGLCDAARAPYRAFAAELGLLVQIADDLLDEGNGDESSYVNTLGAGRARELARESHGRATALLSAIEGDTAELSELTELIATRTA